MKNPYGQFPQHKVITDETFKVFSSNPNDYRKTVKLSELAMTMLNKERAKLSEDCAPDQNVDHIHKEHPPKVEDSIEAVTEKKVPQTYDAKIEPPAKAKNLNVDAESKHKNIKLTGFIPTKVTRGTKDEVPKVNTKELDDSTDMEEVKESDLEPKHFAESTDWSSRLKRLKENNASKQLNEIDWDRMKKRWNDYKKSTGQTGSTNKDTAYAAGRTWKTASGNKFGAKGSNGKIRYFKTQAAADRFARTG